MKNLYNKSYSDHQELSLLLPWYVNKTLHGNDLTALESHLSVCLTCKRELNQLHKLAQAVKQEGSLDSAEQVSFARLKKRLHAGDQLDLQSLPQQQRKDTVGNVRQLDKARKPAWANAISRPALALAAAVLLSLAVIMPRYYIDNSPQVVGNYRTLSSDAQLNEIAIANEIRVVFAENIDQGQKNKILERVNGQIVASPTAQGVYTVRLDRNIASKRLLDVVESLRKDSNVIFAEPAYALLSSSHREK